MAEPCLNLLFKLGALPPFWVLRVIPIRAAILDQVVGYFLFLYPTGLTAVFSFFAMELLRF